MMLGMDIAGTPSSDLEDCGRVVRFMQSIDYAGMSPHDELATGGTQYVLASPEGNYELCWFDCAAGRWVIQPHLRVKGGSGALARPSGLGDEVALYVRRKVYG